MGVGWIFVSNLGLKEEGVGLPLPSRRSVRWAGEGYHMAWVNWIDWNAFSEALGHLKFYICRMGGGLGWRRTGGRLGERASGGGRAGGRASGRAGGRAEGRVRGYHMACC